MEAVEVYSIHIDDRLGLNRSLPAGGYDVVTAFETIHDMAQPSRCWRASGRLMTDDGLMVVMDEAVGETFTPGTATSSRR